MPKSLPEVFVSNSAIASYVSKKLKTRELRKLGSRVYTTNLKEKPEVLIRRHAWFLVEELFPGAVIADRTALEHRPAADGAIFIVSSKKRPVVLPGLSIHPRKGRAHLPEDKPFMEGLFLSCPARAYLENMRKSRPGKERVARTLSRKEIEEKLDALLRSAGPEALLALRDEARRIAKLLGAQKEWKALDALIGTLLGTRKAPLASPVGLARLRGEPYDPKRLDLFQKLYETLSVTPTVIRTIAHEGMALPFFEAYFSNFIEGTEFEVEEAARIIFEGKIPKGRPADAHDIIGTYQIVSDVKEMRRVPKDVDELILFLKRRHAHLMQGRPEMEPGEFKTVANRAGSTLFVAPDLVEGTLRQGFKWFQGLQTPFQRAVYMMFLIAEVHPFSDGNGRCARLMMNAELIAGGQARIIIPTIFRNNYLVALKSLTHNGKAEPLIRVLDFAQEYTCRIDWSDFKRAKKMLVETNAFEDANQGELKNVRLILP
ncbi:MAG: Fic family protein [Verrucomicrobiota bacterium]|nr:Fic family protein [Verrucomicrobiota bacterium]